MGRECTEHTRLCFSWKQPPSTYVAGSVVTGVSTLCNLANYDISKYREMLDNLAETSTDIEGTLDEFPAGAEQHSEDRYSKARRDRDLTNEEEQLLLIEALLSRYQEERDRLREVHSDDEEPEDDAIDVGRDHVSAFGLTSQTQTHYTFEELLPRIGLEVPTVPQVLGDPDLDFVDAPLGAAGGINTWGHPSTTTDPHA